MSKHKNKPEPLFKPASPKQALMLKRALDTQIVILGGAAGSGKSTILNYIPALLVDDPKTSVALYRETNPMLEDGFWPNGREIWESLPSHFPEGYHVSRVREQKKEIILKNGARIKYKQAANVARAIKDAQGQEVTLYGLDEGTQFDFKFIEYLMSRLRSPSKHFSRMIITCNPDPDHKIRELIDYYLDGDGYPIKERDGDIRYFYRVDGDFVWGNSKEELSEKTGIEEHEWDDKFISFSFVSATIHDNPVMKKLNPTYQAYLEGLNPVDKAQLLWGCWDARAKGANYFERDWLHQLDKIPYSTNWVRAYDFAATERSQVNKDPDPTVSVKMCKDRDGYFTIVGDYHKNFYDEVLDVEGRMCKRIGERDNIILQQAQWDGRDVCIVAPQDPAAAGKHQFNEQSKFFSSNGFLFKKDPIPYNKSKLTKFLPFANSAENGLIRIVKSSFSPKTYEYIMKELEAFNGERSSTERHDDFADCIASAYNYLCQQRVSRKFAIPSNISNTALSKHRQLVN